MLRPVFVIIILFQCKIPSRSNYFKKAIRQIRKENNVNWPIRNTSTERQTTIRVGIRVGI